VLSESSQRDKCESHKGEKDKCSDYSDFCFHLFDFNIYSNLNSNYWYSCDTSCHKLMRVWCECLGVVVPPITLLSTIILLWTSTT